MPKPQTVRFASGASTAPYSGVWRVVADRSDVYIGTHKQAMGLMKLSLHSSGVWVFAATKQSGAHFADGNRRGKQWTRPLEHAHGITRGPSILIPYTSLGARKVMPAEVGKKLHWYRAPQPGETVEFSLYLGSTPILWTVWLRLQIFDPAGRLYDAFAGCGTSPGNRTRRLAPHPESDTGGGSRAPA